MGRAAERREGNAQCLPPARAPTAADAVITPFLPPVDERSCGRKGLVSMAHIAASDGRFGELESLLDKGFKVDERSGGWTLLHCAASSGRLQCVELLVSRGAALDLDSPDGGLYECGTPLSLAAARGHAGVVVALLAGGANADAGHALHSACEHGRVEIARVLIAAGADRDALGEDDETALERATYACHARYALSEVTLAEIETFLST